MTLKRIEIQFVQCNLCGEHGPAVFGADAAGALARDAAREQGWTINEDDDVCVDCDERMEWRDRGGP